MSYHQLLGFLLVVVSCTSASELTSSKPWLLRSTGYYQIVKNGLTWQEAYNNCMNEGGHLLIVDSEEEAKVIKSLMEAEKINLSHVGVHDLFSEGNFVTIFGEPLSETSFRWSAGEPNNLRNAEHCGTIRKDGYLNDLPCGTHDFKVPSICEGLHFY